jgi:hypothetical protein
VIPGRDGLAREHGVHPLHADHAGPVQAELAQGPESRIGGTVTDVELHRVPIGPARGPGPHHHVLDSGGGGEPVGQLLGEGGRAHRADVQH